MLAVQVVSVATISLDQTGAILFLILLRLLVVAAAQVGIRETSTDKMAVAVAVESTTGQLELVVLEAKDITGEMLDPAVVAAEVAWEPSEVMAVVEQDGLEAAVVQD